MLISNKEFLQIFDNVENEHPNLYHDISKEGFVKQLNKVADKVETMDKPKLTFELCRLFALFKDGHTRIYEIDEQPFTYKLIAVQDKIYIAGIKKELQSLLMCPVSRLGGKDISEVVSIGKQLIMAETPQWRQYSLLDRLRYPYFLSALDLLNDGNELTLTIDDKDYILPYNNNEMVLIPQFCNQTKQEVKDAGDICYIRFSSNCEDKNYPFKQVYQDIKRHLSKGKRVVVDLRYNEGGPSTNFDKVVDALKDNECVGCCLINEGTFSGGTVDTKRLVNIGFTTIGSSMGQPVQYYGNSGKKYDVPQLGLRYRSSISEFNLNSGLKHPMSEQPDVFVENTHTDYVNNVDRVLQTALDFLQTPLREQCRNKLD